jgi:hypothetical protein
MVARDVLVIVQCVLPGNKLGGCRGAKSDTVKSKSRNCKRQQILTLLVKLFIWWCAIFLHLNALIEEKLVKYEQILLFADFVNGHENFAVDLVD